VSGGHFEYKQYNIQHIADEIEQIIAENKEEHFSYHLGTLREFKYAIKLLKEAHVYAQRIDWLVSGDDGEDTFHRRLEEDLKKLRG